MFDLYYLNDSGYWEKFGKSLNERARDIFVIALRKVPGVKSVIAVPAQLEYCYND